MSRPSAVLPDSIPCKHCGISIRPLNSRHKYCSEKCMVSWSKLFGTRKYMQEEYNRTKRLKYAQSETLRKKIVDGAREYRRLHPDRVKAVNDKYRDSDERREHAAQKSRKWHAANKERANTRRIVRKQVQRTERPWSVMLVAARKRAKDSSIPFELTDDWAKARWTGVCELTGIPFRIVRGMGTKILAPSLDRIVPSLGYVQGNCRFILFCVNAFKHNGTDTDMYMVAEALMKAKSLRDAAHELGQIAAAE